MKEIPRDFDTATAKDIRGLSFIGYGPQPTAPIAIFWPFLAISLTTTFLSFTKTDVQTVILRCWTGLNINWVKSGAVTNRHWLSHLFSGGSLATAHCSCQKIRSVFRVLGIYDFEHNYNVQVFISHFRLKASTVCLNDNYQGPIFITRQ